MKEKYYFSPSVLGFYPESIKEVYVAAGTWPDDLVEITEKQYLKSREPVDGKELDSDTSGKPVRKKVALSEEEAKSYNISKINKAISSANTAMQPYVFVVESGEATDEDQNKLKQYKDYIIKLHRLKSGDLSKIIKMPSAPKGV